ncbi:hypothetical protein X734_23445 [Mesorhizobium sp. L2C084A000]|nr:hypothetical protein X734_23445 [Mesorhizobium sp. L2C084A000]
MLDVREPDFFHVKLVPPDAISATIGLYTSIALPNLASKARALLEITA